MEAIDSCNLSVIGKFLMCKPFNKRAVKTTLRRAWGMDDRMQILEVGLNLFQFKFQLEFDMNHKFQGGPWTFDNQLLMLQQWRNGITVGNIQMDYASLWIQKWRAPLDMIYP